MRRLHAWRSDCAGPGRQSGCIPAAINRHVAEEAAGLIEVEYEPLPCVLTAPEAMQEGAPLMHEDLKTKELGEATAQASNVAEHLRFAVGDIDAGPDAAAADESAGVDGGNLETERLTRARGAHSGDAAGVDGRPGDGGGGGEHGARGGRRPGASVAGNPRPAGGRRTASAEPFGGGRWGGGSAGPARGGNGGERDLLRGGD